MTWSPVVLRRIEVPLSIRLDGLHAVLQAAIGWTNSHLWEIRAGDAGWEIPDRDWGDGPELADEVWATAPTMSPPTRAVSSPDPYSSLDP